MIQFFRKHINTLFFVSLGINIVFFVFVALRIYHYRYPHYINYSNSDRYGSILAYDSVPAGKVTDKRILFNTLIEKYGYSSYLEIGQGMAENNFNWIKCRIRIGVDPDPECNAAYCLTSDEFFELNKSTFDLIFIDGLHQADQAFRDIINALKILNHDGTIVVHDCNPLNEAMQMVPRIQDVWTGDVWRAWVWLRSTRDDLEMFVVDNDSGFGVIRRGIQDTVNVPDTLSYRLFDENRKDWLNLRSVNYFLDFLK